MVGHENSLPKDGELNVRHEINFRGDNSHRLGYGMCHFLRVLFWLKNKFLGQYFSLQ